MPPEDIQGLRLLLNRIAEMAHDVRHADAALKAGAQVAVTSINRNFDVQGRPPFKGLSQSTLAGRRRGRGRGGPKILQDTGRLKGSIHATPPTGGSVKIATNVVYAARQHYGYPGGTGPGHSKTPARPYMMLQEPEDIRAIGEIFKRHIARK